MSPVMTVTATTTTTLKLKPQVKKRLLMELRTYAELKTQRDALDQAMKGHRGHVEEILVETGEQSIAIEGFKSTFVSPTRSKLEPKKLIAQGVTIAQIEAATVITPGKSYVKITVPGGRDEEGD